MNNTTKTGPSQIYVASTPFPTANSYVPLTTYAIACNSSTTIDQSWNRKGEIWKNHWVGQGGGYSHVMTPHKKACLFSGDGSQEPGHTLIGTSSNHSGGVNVGMLDGSVRFVKDSVSQQTWWGIATMADGEVIDASSF